VKLYNSTDGSEPLFAGTHYTEDWSRIVSNLSFSTKNPGGFSECGFSITTASLEAFSEYADSLYRWVSVEDGLGHVLWRGRIEEVSYEPGQVSFVCAGSWSSAFDTFYDDGSFSGNPGAEHSILNADSTRELDTTYVYLAQSFQLSEPLAVRDIGIRLTNDGLASRGSYIKVYLCEDNSGSPENVNYALATASIQVATIGSEETISTGLTTSYRLNADTPYWIVIGAGASTVTTSTVGWRYDSTQGYTGGAMKYYTSSWNAFTGDAIFYVWTHPRFYYYSIDVSNGDFEETAGAGTFDDWTDNAGTGAIAIETSSVYEGTNAAKLTAGVSVDTYIYQDIPVVMGSDYTLSFYTRGDGTYAGRYRIYDVTNSADIVATTATGVTGTTYTLVEDAFTVPATCESVRIYLYCPGTNGGIAYFDAVAVDGDYASAADVIANAAAATTFLVSDESFLEIDGPAVNPIAFTNNEKPGDVINKVLSFGSGDATPLPVFFGLYEGEYTEFRSMPGGRVWYIGTGNLAYGQQGLALTTSAKSAKTRVGTLYSGVVGERNKTEWVINSDLYNHLGFHVEGLYSIAGANEAVADIVAGVVASAYAGHAASITLLVEGNASVNNHFSLPTRLIRAGDSVNVSKAIPASSISQGVGINIENLNVQETSYDVGTGRMSVVVTGEAFTVVDVILALAGLSGGSMI